MLGGIALETRPGLRARNDVAQGRHHLAAIARAECELCGICEKCSKLIAQLRIEQNRGCPAAASAEYVAVGKSTAGRDAVEFIQTMAPVLQVGHVHIECVETCARERRGHFDLAVDALIAQHRNLRPRALVDARCSYILRWIKAQLRRDSRFIVVTTPGEFGLRTFRVVAAFHHRKARFRPGRHQVAPRPTRDRFATEPELDAFAAAWIADEVRNPGQAMIDQQFLEILALAGANLHDGTEFLSEQRG